MPVEALIFDFDGLILDTEWPEFSTVRDEFARHGVVLQLEDWHDIVGRADHPHWFDWLQSEVETPLDRSAVVERRRQRHHALIAEQVVRPGVVELIAAAVGEGSVVVRHLHDYLAACDAGCPRDCRAGGGACTRGQHPAGVAAPRGATRAGRPTRPA